MTGSVLWLKADTIDLNDGDAVATWADSSGNGNDAAQEDEDSKPTLDGWGVNGRPAVKFWERLIGMPPEVVPETMTTSLVLPQPFTAIVVASVVSSTEGAVFGDDNLSAMLYNDRDDGGWMRVYCGSNGISGPVAALDAPHIMSAVVDGASTYLAIDGAKGSPGDPGSNFPNPLVLGYSGDGYYLGVSDPGEIAEVVAFDRMLSDADRVAVETYLSKKYGIALA
jgi:hypothetical protein